MILLIDWRCSVIWPAMVGGTLIPARTLDLTMAVGTREATSSTPVKQPPSGKTTPSRSYSRMEGGQRLSLWTIFSLSVSQVQARCYICSFWAQTRQTSRACLANSSSPINGSSSTNRANFGSDSGPQLLQRTSGGAFAHAHAHIQIDTYIHTYIHTYR